METIAGQARVPPTAVMHSELSDWPGGQKPNKKEYLRKVRELKDNRVNFEKRWKAIRDYELPFLGSFLDTSDATDNARRRDEKIYDGTPWEANQAFAAGIMSGLTPQNRRWFRLSFSERDLGDNTDVARLLDQRMDILNDVLDKSNFYNAVHATYLELAFGQAVLGIFPDPVHGVHFTPYTIGSYYLAAGADGKVNTFCYECLLTTRQIADKFGEEKLTHNMREELKNGAGLKRKHKVYWYVEENAHADRNRLGRQYLPYISLYWLDEAQENEWLYVGGCYEWPVPVGRYLVLANDPYGAGPGWFAEGDSKQLQVMSKDMLRIIELMAKPPMQSDEETAKNGINLAPGSNTVRGKGDQTGVTPLFQFAGDLDHLRMAIAETEERVKRAYSADLFRMLDMQDKSMTAREVMERTNEKMQQLGPVVQRMQFEFLSNIIERVYNILDRAGVFPQPDNPDLAQTLAQQEIRIEYISPLAQAQKMSGLVNIEQGLAFVANVAQMSPDVLDKIDYSEAVSRYLDMVGAPAPIKRSDDDFKKIQAQKQAAQQQQQQTAQAMQMAQAAAPAAQAAKAATDAAQNGNPALRQLLGFDEAGLGMRSGV